jgi:hypothetical protein
MLSLEVAVWAMSQTQFTNADIEREFLTSPTQARNFAREMLKAGLVERTYKAKGGKVSGGGPATDRCRYVPRFKAKRAQKALRGKLS